ncbi:MAG: M48 family metallopeptidase [Candidatus Kapaibacterium sp.]
MQNSTEQYFISRRRVKNARISVNHELHVKVVIPLWYKEKDVAQLFAEKRHWIEKQLVHFAKAQKNIPRLEEGEILYLGERINPGFDVGDKKLLQLWYLEKARELYTGRINALSAEHGFTYSKLTLRNQKTRWGSCSKKKNISLNWKLIKTPLYVIDYVILHELTHTQFFDHSRSFWQKLEQVCPDYKQALAWLKKYGRYL